MGYENQPFDIEAKVRQDCYNRGYEKGKKDAATEILRGFNKWLNKAISDSYDRSVSGCVRQGGMNTAFHEVKELVKKVAESEGVEVE